MVVDVWVSRDKGSRRFDLWESEPDEHGGFFESAKPIWLDRINQEAAERLGYGVPAGKKRRVRMTPVEDATDGK